MRTWKKKDKLHSLDSLENQLYGEKGTPGREAYEAELKKELEKEKQKKDNEK